LHVAGIEWLDPPPPPHTALISTAPPVIPASTLS
jgi:hypothetical protein